MSEDAAPHDAPRRSTEADGERFQDGASHGANLLFWAFLAAALFSLSIYVATYVNAWRQDPWMTPRHSQSMSLWWRLGGPMSGVMLLCLPFGVSLCWTAPTPRKQLIAGSLVAAILFFFTLFGF